MTTQPSEARNVLVMLRPRLNASLRSFVQRRNKFQFLLAAATLIVGVAMMCCAEWGQIHIALLIFLLFRRTLALPTVYLSTAGKSVLVTGCDHGFGEGAMRKLQERGFRVFAGCLTQAKVVLDLFFLFSSFFRSKMSHHTFHSSGGPIFARVLSRSRGASPLRCDAT